ncbi:AP-4 complex accessory subunit tepsin [Perognathus longimembris pacificus]|uniref:AP-4 complex accessory subunit tepsin n=1 Tax=Perognathus longimembris pacificus TaxID=214514 RepID=UPI00201868EA|nr:AP-4 complex accessory subunit tepsin [Perognathus longimembris pacificus]
MAAAPPLRDRLSFLHRLPILLKGTSDDDSPCPGYLFEEIAKISHESLGSSQCLLEYLLKRLDSSSGHVKLKVLKILLYLCGHGSSSFLLILKRNSAFIQEATVFAGPPDPLHGNSLYQKVRAAAQDLGSTLFSDALLPPPPSQTPRAPPPAGMGSQARSHGALQGFGYSQEPGRAGSAGEALLATVQRAAEVVAKAVRPGPELVAAQRPLPRGDAYQPATPPPAGHRHLAARSLLPGARAVRHQPGLAGGGWEELDSSPSSRDSSRASDRSRASDSGSRRGSDSLSAGGREPGSPAERAEAEAPGDRQPELSLVRSVARGPRAFLSREETQRFTRQCGLLNCEVVLELLLCQLGRAGEDEQMRALCAVAALAGADLLPQERVLLLSRPRLQQLSAASPGPLTSKATKILRHLEAACGPRPPAPRPPAPARRPSAAVPSLCDLLTDPAPPPGGPAFLQPLGSAPALPHSPAPTPAAGPCLPPGPGAPGTAQSPPGRCPRSHGSLFAGMELVARPHLGGSAAAVEEPGQAPSSPQTAAPERPGPEPSAFPFLNV